ncbi:ubiquitin-activating E1 family protein [Galactobacter caseinivorans]|uniref:THIF-type NAD/FAD binding fold domain-containing protein n=1 Tax=Galactobacter caseinivorans TaxID=2676123 RepID=A0A496PM69_9MICC|nr:hypothetical protein [Galactobacter caseinivorans]RKW71622.1 hypothetical protein DWQ67_01920 [Galactobacter caseinivorans]
MRINPGVRLLANGRGTVRVGTGPGHTELHDVSEADLDVLRRLARGETIPPPPPNSDAALARGRLLQSVAHVLVDSEPCHALPGLAADRLRTDGYGWAGAFGRSGEHPLEGRLRRRVWISGLDRCGMALAFTLAAAGVGQLALADDTPVAPDDLGSSPLRLTELGLPRPAAVARHVARLYPHTHVLSPVSLTEAERGTDLLVLVVRDGIEAGLAARLGCADLPVLPVVFHEGGFRVGPLALPGAAGCEACRSEAWRVLEEGEELLGGGASPETTSAVLAAGLAAQAVVMVLDGVFAPSVVNGAYVGTLGAAAIHFEPLPASCAHGTAEQGSLEQGSIEQGSPAA